MEGGITMTPLKSLPSLWLRIACTFNQTNQKTVDTFKKRISTSLETFLFVDLPQLGKDLDRGLSSGTLHLSSGHFKKLKDSEIPVFMQEYFLLVFDREGRLRDEVEVGVVRRIRTLCYLFYKFELPFTDDQKIAAYGKFIEIDDQVKTDFDERSISRLYDTFNSLLPDYPLDIKPRHSSGVTADRVNNVEKRVFRRFIPELMKVYGGSFFFNTANHLSDWLARNELVHANPSSRIALVPKDARGPRIICMEPHERMFVQQGLMQKIYDHVEYDSPARGRVNFTRQDINQRLAYLGSLDGSYATIDLKDASDLVSWSLISRIVREDWLAALAATRSATVEMENGVNRQLKKFAPMGSALCFPIEAILFYSIATLVTKDVWVYGDDIIVPNRYAMQVIDMLHQYGLKVNLDKSLFTGNFRESCGADYFRGDIITPIRCRRLGLDSHVAFANNLADAFGDETGTAAIEWYESINHSNPKKGIAYSNVVLRLPLSYKGKTNLLAYFTDRHNMCLFRRRYNKNYQRYELRSLSGVSTRTVQGGDNYDFLFDWFTNREDSVRPEEDTHYHKIMEGLGFDRTTKPDWAGTVQGKIQLMKHKLKYVWGDVSHS